MCDAMVEMGMALDGGKDSLSMAAKVNGDTVKAPGELVISLYAPCTGTCAAASKANEVDAAPS